MTDDVRVTDQGRFAAADWLESALVNNGVETGGGWPLALVDGIIHLLASVPDARKQPEPPSGVLFEGREPSE